MFELTSLHQKIIHFPVAFLILYPFVEIIGLIKKTEFIDKLSLIFISIGTLSLILALISGNITLNNLSNISENDLSIINQHTESANYLAFSTGTIFLLRIYFRNKLKEGNFYRLIIIFLSLFMLYFVFKTGELGGITNETLSRIKVNLEK